MEEKAIVVQNLVKQYPKVRAVDDVSFSVDKGEIFGLLGPNGAGKNHHHTRPVDAYPAHVRGTLIYNINTAKNSEDVRRICGYVPPGRLRGRRPDVLRKCADLRQTVWHASQRKEAAHSGSA